MPKVLEVDVPSFDDAICVLALGSDPRELMNSGMTVEDALSSERAVASGRIRGVPVVNAWPG